MGISGAQIDIAGEHAVIPDGDGCTLDGCQLCAAIQAGVISNLNGVPVAFDAENHMVEVAPLPYHDGIVASADIHLAVMQSGQVANHQLVSRAAADNAASPQPCDPDFLPELSPERIEEGQMIINAQQRPESAPVFFQNCNDLLRIHKQRHTFS